VRPRKRSSFTLAFRRAACDARRIEIADFVSHNLLLDRQSYFTADSATIFLAIT